MNFDDVITRLNAIADHRETELRRLAAEPSLARFAEAFMDQVQKDLSYFCHFESVADHNGNVTPMLEVLTAMQEQLAATYTRLTGQEYRPEICRRVDAREVTNE